MSHREIKSNTYGTCTHFSCFLQNWSSCKTIIIEILQQVSVPCLPKDTVAIQYHRRSGMSIFKFWGSNLSQIFKMHFKGVVLELLVSNCKTEKRGIQSHGFPPESSFPALDGCVDRLSTEAFLPWLDLVCPLLMQVSYSSLLVLPPRRGGDAPGIDLMTSQTDLAPNHQDLSLIFAFL